MKNAILLFLLIFSCKLNAQEDKTVNLVVSGSGKTQDEAKQNALRSAIEQAFGAFISSKTEILNDNLVKDEIVSVSSGNIKSFKLISEAKTSDDNYSVIVNATISVSKLTNFAESKGINIEFNGELLALNIQQQIVNEKNELLSIKNIAETCKSILLTSYDYKLSNGKPIQSKVDKNKWEVPILVDVAFNPNILNFRKYLTQSIVGLSMSADEVAQYTELGKKTYNIIFGDSSIGGTTRDINYLKNVTRNNPNIIFQVKQYNEIKTTTTKIKTAIESFKALGSTSAEIVYFDNTVNPILYFRNESTALEIIRIMNFTRNAAMNFKIDNGIHMVSPDLKNYHLEHNFEGKYYLGNYNDGAFIIIHDSLNYILRACGRTSIIMNFITPRNGSLAMHPLFENEHSTSLRDNNGVGFGYTYERNELSRSVLSFTDDEMTKLYNTKFGFLQFVDSYVKSIYGNRGKPIFYAVVSLFDFKPTGRTVLQLKTIDKLTLDELKVLKNYSVSKK